MCTDLHKASQQVVPIHLHIQVPGTHIHHNTAPHSRQPKAPFSLSFTWYILCVSRTCLVVVALVWWAVAVS